MLYIGENLPGKAIFKKDKDQTVNRPCFRSNKKAQRRTGTKTDAQARSKTGAKKFAQPLKKMVMYRLGCIKEQSVWQENERTKKKNKQKRAVLRGTFRKE